MSTKLINTDNDFFSCVFGGVDDRDSTEARQVSFKGTERIKKFKKFASLDLSIKKTKLIASKEEYVISEHFDHVENLGIGTYSYVKHSIEKSTGRPVAIKTSRRTTAREMLKQEYEILKRINHPNIIQPYELIQNDTRDESYLVMEYFEGTSLSELVENKGALDEEDAKYIFLQLIDCVKSLHRVGICHRDLKPENVLVDDQNKVKLIDFNISKFVAPDSIEAHRGDNKFTSIFLTQISSPLYAAPEIKNNCIYSESVDIWGLGIILFTSLFGTFESHELNKIISCNKRCNSIHSIIDGSEVVNDELKNIMKCLLHEDPEARPSAEEITFSA